MIITGNLLYSTSNVNYFLKMSIICVIVWNSNNLSSYANLTNENYLLNTNETQIKQQLTESYKISILRNRFMNAREIRTEGNTILFIDSCNSILRDVKTLTEIPYFIQYIYNSLGNAYRNLGNLFLSQKYLELALFYDNKTYDKILNIPILTNLALIELEKREFKKVLEIYKTILNSNSNIINYDLNIIYNNIAYCASKINDTLVANANFNKLINLNKKSANQYKSVVFYRNYGKYLQNQEEFKESKKYLDNALQESLTQYGKQHYQVAKCYQYLGDWQISQNNLDSAKINYEKALENARHNIIYSPEGEPVWVSTSYETVFIEILNESANLYYKIARNYINSNKTYNLIKAIENYKLAINGITYLSHGITDESSKFIIAEKGREIFNRGVICSLELYELTDNQEYFDLALQWSIQAKSLSLKWLAEKNKSYESVGISEDIVLDLARDRSKINEFMNNNKRNMQSTIDDRLIFLIRDYEEKEKLIQEKFPNIQNIIKTNWSVNDLKKTLKKETYLGYYDLDTTVIIFCINENHQFYEYISIDSEKKDLIIKYKKILYQSNLGSYTGKEINEFTNYSYQLYEWLINPIEELFINNKLSIHPDGNLLGFPFETLIYTQIDESENYSFKSLNYLFNKYLIRYINGQMVEEKNIKSKNTRICIFANKTINKLPGIKNEISSISRLLSDYQVVYLEENTSELLDNPFKADFIHIANHNTVNFSEPLKSGFTNTAEQDTINLSFLDILQTGNKYSFAYINACESGFGPVNKGEGFISIGLAFMMRGTESTIQHLWKASDHAASTISQNFYKLLRTTNSCNALRKAKKKYLENAAPGLDHPYYWSGVVYYGQNWKLSRINWPLFIIIFSGLIIILYLVFRKRIFRSNFFTSSL